jgi:hypothetical protein
MKTLPIFHYAYITLVWLEMTVSCFRYPTPTQKMAVANAIVETFPTLAAKMKASHISPAVSTYIISHYL